MLWFGIAYLITSAGFAAFIYLLYRDREYWRAKYEARDEKSVEREQKLYDQLLRVKGFRLVDEPLAPMAPQRSAVALDPEAFDVMADRINERVEHGMLTPSEGMNLVHEMRMGLKTQAEIDRVLLQRQAASFEGTAADIIG